MFSRLLVATAVLLTAAIPFRLFPQTPSPGSRTPDDQETIVLSLFLIGDAGAARDNGIEPVFAALEKETARHPRRSFVLFLGDNIYPSGLPDTLDEWRGEAERRLGEQASVLERSGASGAFLTGNHDWAHGREDGWAAVLRQEEWLARKGIRLLPPGGCPGPAVLELQGRLRLVLLDTQWWLHRYMRPEHGDCVPAAGETSVLDALARSLLTDNQLPVLVAGHHPLVTYGTHGGRFPFLDHLFPLRNVHPWLWIPLPLLGSLYPVARAGGLSNQDLSSPLYASFARKVDSVLTLSPPIAYAAGHEHSLQVIRDARAYTVLVSGNGIAGHNEPLGTGPGLLYGSTDPGFMRIDVGKDGGVNLTVVEVGDDPDHTTTAFRMELRPPPGDEVFR